MILLSLCFIGAALAGALFASSSVFDSDDPIKRFVNNDSEEELIKATDKVTIIIMGVDVRKDDVGRSDTLMIATVDPRIDQATLLSIPRDTRVRIRGRGYDKINAAFAYGGVELTTSTVENFLGIDIDHYIMIDTSSFVKIIDAIGGVDIDVEKRMVYEDPWDDNGGLVIDLYPGQQHMDGKTAVTYVRYRDSEGDIGRVKRQQA
ncbi:MAG: LCP family protein, partial [Selenomonadaceae bacterium]|nr:LCP family protein [Selenomonadaceae bacterium]